MVDAFSLVVYLLGCGCSLLSHVFDDTGFMVVLTLRAHIVRLEERVCPCSDHPFGPCDSWEMIRDSKHCLDVLA